jgi:hypothetical protein
MVRLVFSQVWMANKEAVAIDGDQNRMAHLLLNAFSKGGWSHEAAY